MDEGQIFIIDRVCSSLLSSRQIAAAEPPPMIHFEIHAKRQRPIDIAKVVLIEGKRVVLVLDGKAKRKKTLEMLWRFVYPNGLYYEIAVEKTDVLENDMRKYTVFVLFPLVYVTNC